MGATFDKFSAAASGLGYFYQARRALLLSLESPESSALYMEKDDDVDLLDDLGRRTLFSLKHKAPGDRLTNLSLDFWKSLRIWATRYIDAGRQGCELSFVLLTTSEVALSSLLHHLLSESVRPADLGQKLLAEGATSTSASVMQTLGVLTALNKEELEDLVSRIRILGAEAHIVDVESQVTSRHMRTVRRENRAAVYERLEGWWMGQAISILSGERADPVTGFEVADLLSAIASEYGPKTLPIHYRNALPEEPIDSASDSRLFVVQLKQLGLSQDRIRWAIVDFYRAFQQRSMWARENVLITGEIEEFESRLREEWERYKDLIFESLEATSTEDVLQKAGRDLYNWAQSDTDYIRIRDGVSEPYVTRGGFHILANVSPTPHVYWHPRFLQHLSSILESQ